MVPPDALHLVAPLKVGSASTRLAASVPFLFSFPRNFSASHIVFCSLQSLAHQQLPMLNQPFRVFQKPRMTPYCSNYSSRQTQFLIIFLHCFNLSSQIWFVCSLTHGLQIEISISIFSLNTGWCSRSVRLHILSCGNSQSGGSCSLVCRICTWYVSLSAFPSLFNMSRLHVKFCFCDEASFSFSATETSFVFASSNSLRSPLENVSASPQGLMCQHCCKVCFTGNKVLFLQRGFFWFL